MIEAGGSAALALVIVALASYRLTRIVTADSLTYEFRQRAYRWAWSDEGEAPTPRAAWRTYAYELTTCSFCLGVWVSAGAYAAWRWGPEWGRTGLVIAAIAGAQAYISSRPGA